MEEGGGCGGLRANLDSWVIMTLLKRGLHSLILLPMRGGIYGLSP